MQALWNFRSPQQLSAGFLLWSPARRKGTSRGLIIPLCPPASSPHPPLRHYLLLDSLSWWNPLYWAGRGKQTSIRSSSSELLGQQLDRNCTAWCLKSRHESVESFLSWWSNGNRLNRQSHNQKGRGSKHAAVSLNVAQNKRISKIGTKM